MVSSMWTSMTGLEDISKILEAKVEIEDPDKVIEDLNEIEEV